MTFCIFRKLSANERMMNDVFVRHIPPFTQLLNVESQFLIECMRTFTIKEFVQLVDRLLSQGYIALRLEKSFKKFYGRYQDLIEKYQRSVNVMVNDSFPG